MVNYCATYSNTHWNICVARLVIPIPVPVAQPPGVVPIPPAKVATRSIIILEHDIVLGVDCVVLAVRQPTATHSLILVTLSGSFLVAKTGATDGDLEVQELHGIAPPGKDIIVHSTVTC